jgi:hypothetical protein
MRGSFSVLLIFVGFIAITSFNGDSFNFDEILIIINFLLTSFRCFFFFFFLFDNFVKKCIKLYAILR